MTPRRPPKKKGKNSSKIALFLCKVAGSHLPHSPIKQKSALANQFHLPSTNQRFTPSPSPTINILFLFSSSTSQRHPLTNSIAVPSAYPSESSFRRSAVPPTSTFGSASDISGLGSYQINASDPATAHGVYLSSSTIRNRYPLLAFIDSVYRTALLLNIDSLSLHRFDCSFVTPFLAPNIRVRPQRSTRFSRSVSAIHLHQRPPLLAVLQGLSTGLCPTLDSLAQSQASVSYTNTHSTIHTASIHVPAISS